MNEPVTIWVGLDIAKATFAACLLDHTGKETGQTFANTDAGFAHLMEWTQQLAGGQMAHFCMEATGTYGLALADFLVTASQAVSVINPFRAKHAALAYGKDNKTDPVDARTLAHFCRKEQPPLWQPSSPEVRLLIGLLKRLQTVELQRQQEANRLSEPGVLAPVQRAIERSLAFLDAETAQLEAEITAQIDSQPPLKRNSELLQSIPGIGAKTARLVLAVLSDVTQFADAQAVAAYVGLAPKEYRSGSSIKKATRLSKRGNPTLRKALYFPALTATRHNPRVKALYDRLIAAGRPRMVAVGAAMRKLLMLCYGVLKSQQKFTPEPVKNPA